MDLMDIGDQQQELKHKKLLTLGPGDPAEYLDASLLCVFPEL